MRIIMQDHGQSLAQNRTIVYTNEGHIGLGVPAGKVVAIYANGIPRLTQFRDLDHARETLQARGYVELVSKSELERLRQRVRVTELSASFAIGLFIGMSHILMYVRPVLRATVELWAGSAAVGVLVYVIAERVLREAWGTRR